MEIGNILFESQKKLFFHLSKNTTWQKTDRQVPLLRKLWRDGKWPTSTAG